MQPKNSLTAESTPFQLFQARLDSQLNPNHSLCQDGRIKKKTSDPDVNALCQETGRLKVELDWVKKNQKSRLNKDAKASGIGIRASTEVIQFPDCVSDYVPAFSG